MDNLWQKFYHFTRIIIWISHQQFSLAEKLLNCSQEYFCSVTIALHLCPTFPSIPTLRQDCKSFDSYCKFQIHNLIHAFAMSKQELFSIPNIWDACKTPCFNTQGIKAWKHRSNCQSRVYIIKCNDTKYQLLLCVSRRWRKKKMAQNKIIIIIIILTTLIPL